jgi:hypothetical protein
VQLPVKFPISAPRCGGGASPAGEPSFVWMAKVFECCPKRCPKEIFGLLSIYKFLYKSFILFCDLAGDPLIKSQMICTPGYALSY